MSRFANSIGIFDVKIGEVELNMKPEMKDIRNFRDIMTDPTIKTDKKKAYNKFSDFMFELIERNEPEEVDVEENNKQKVELREFVEININGLFDECSIAFKWTTREQLEKTKNMDAEKLKKLMSND